MRAKLPKADEGEIKWLMHRLEQIEQRLANVEQWMDSKLGTKLAKVSGR
jgi:tetrahydromethanopterin S-methyltransferase subunit G